MLEVLATTLVILVALYVLGGIVFAVFFVRRGVDVIDPSAEEGTWGFRLLIFPGSVAFWPLMLGRYRARQPPPEERSTHRELAQGAAATERPTAERPTAEKPIPGEPS